METAAQEASPRERVGSVSDPKLVAAVRALRAHSALLEVLLWVAVAGSVFAVGAVHPWAYQSVWTVAAIGFVAAHHRARRVRALRTVLGRQRVRLQPDGRWITLGPPPSGGTAGEWSFDLDRPPLPTAPLLLPGVMFALWALLQLVPLPPSWVTAVAPLRPALVPEAPAAWRPLSIAPADTLRGLAFVLALVALHQLAAAVLDHREARRRFVRGVSILGLLLTAVAFAQVAADVRDVYGFVLPEVGHGHVFGPFINRNHFAGYMLLVVPLTFAVLARAYEHYARRIGGRSNLRRRLVGLSSPEGVALVYATVPALATTGALFATGSRGAAAAFAAGLVVAGLVTRGRGRRAVGAATLVLVVVAGSWLGYDRWQKRLLTLDRQAVLRVTIWQQAWKQLPGVWLTGTGLDTFHWAVSRTQALRLPAGATPYRMPLGSARVAFLVPPEGEHVHVYNEAHNDWLQLLVETGAVGVVLAAWGAARVFARVRHDPWLVAAVCGLLLHAFVDFDFQIPAIPVLFVAVAALRPD